MKASETTITNFRQRLDACVRLDMTGIAQQIEVVKMTSAVLRLLVARALGGSQGATLELGAAVA